MLWVHAFGLSDNLLWLTPVDLVAGQQFQLGRLTTQEQQRTPQQPWKLHQQVKHEYTIYQFLAHLSRRLVVVVVVVVFVVNFSHFHFQNHWANFNQSWHEASLGEGDSNEGPCPLPREIITK